MEQLAAAADLVYNVVWKAENGRNVSADSLHKISLAFQTKVVGFQYVDFRYLTSKVKIVKLPGDAENCSLEDVAKFVSELRVEINANDEARVLDKKTGCIELSVEMSFEDAEKLDRAFRAGRLERLGVLAVRDVRLERRGLHHMIASALGITVDSSVELAERLASLACSAGSFLCSMLMLAIGWHVALPSIGLALSALAVALSHKKRTNLTFAALSVFATAVCTVIKYR